jgi:hypothetical protein
MPDAEERFITAAVAPLGDNAEMRLMAERELRSILEDTKPAIPASSLEVAAGNLERALSRTRGRIALYCLTAVASVAMLIPVWRDYRRLEVARYHVFAMTDAAGALPMMPFVNRADEKLPGIFGEFSVNEIKLLFGDPSKAGDFDQFKVLAVLDPKRAAFHAEYARHFCEWRNPLPMDYLDTADRLDPDNSWFRYLAAGIAARDGVGERSMRSKRGAGIAEVVPFQILKPKALDEAIRLLGEAARLPDYQPYRRELLAERLAIFPPGNDVLGRKLARHYLSDLGSEGLRIHSEMAQAVSVRAYELAMAGDSEGFLRLVNAWEVFCRRSLEAEPVTWMEPFYIGHSLRLAAEHLATAAKDLGLQEEEARYALIQQTFEARRAAVKATYKNEWDRKRGGMERWQFVNRFNSVGNPPPIPDADLMAASLAEHAMLARLLSTAVWLLFLVAATMAALVRFRHGKQTRCVSGSLARVMTWKDHAWIVCVGVLVPFAVFQLVEQFTACSGRDYVLGVAGASDYLRTTAAAIVMASGAFIGAGRCLGKRLGFRGWRRPMIPALIVCGIGIMAWIAGCVAGGTGYEIPINVNEWPQMGLVLTGALACVAPLSAAFVNRDAALRWLTCCRAVLPAYAFAMLVMAATVPCQHAIERYWTSRNHLTKIDPSLPAIDPYDYRIAGLMQAEMLKILDGAE